MLTPVVASVVASLLACTLATALTSTGFLLATGTVAFQGGTSHLDVVLSC